jgi:hypothetical protein
MNRNSAITFFPAVGRIATQKLAGMDAITLMTDEMMSLVAAGDWDALPALQAKRDDALRACFAAPLTEENSELAVVKIKRLLEQNEKLVAAVTIAKSALAEEMGRTRRDAKAVNSYLSVGA